jgi:hypothetical protein
MPNRCITNLALALFLASAAGRPLCGQAARAKVERWDIFEAQWNGPAGGNPYLDVKLQAAFRLGPRTVKVDGFYDGSGVYRVRFMPDTPGAWSYTTASNRAELSGRTGGFECTAAAGRNHGPVRVAHTWHFAYEDGTPYFPFGTTAYAWAHQGGELENQTLETLRRSPFNKLRMCVFPKSYVYNTNEPQHYLFPRTDAGGNDFTRFNPEFFQHFEKLLARLRDLGVEADLILFHPYDRWGYAKMPAAVDDAYLRYVVARFAAYRNVWWSVANEFDFMKEKAMPDWDRFFRIVRESDPYQHLRSIHNGAVIYDHAKPWVTHVSIQRDDFEKTGERLAAWRKPVIYDECKYEGNIPRRWGNISAREMVRRFWVGTVAGAYVGHSETYLDPADVLWWSKGGTLRGESAPRIAFLRKILEEGPAEGLNPTSSYYPTAGREGRYYLCYFDVHQPAEYQFDLPQGVKYRADIIDPWEMTITPAPGTYEGKFTLQLPARPYLAVRIRKAD